MNKDAWLGLIRHVLTFGGGYFVAKGFLDDATMNQMVGAAMTLVGGAWSVAQKQ